MAESTLLKHFFSYEEDIDLEKRFNLNRKARLRRMREIFNILRRHRVLRSFTPAEFREMLEELGPSFVKVGQALSTRSEILPKAYCDELAKLQTECDPLPFDEILDTLHDIYGSSFDTIFAEVDPQPLGSASLAQVHRAELQTGETVAVKVQRPGVKAIMAQDIDIMRSMARSFTHFIKDEQILDLHSVVEEMWQTFLEETDFDCEARNLELFAQLNKDVAFISCPHVYREFCGEYVLVMEYIEGIPIYDTKRLHEAGYDLVEISTKLLDNYATQILDHGFFHADPHPGNIIIRAGQIVYIDLGIMGRLTPTERVGFGDIINAVGMSDAGALKESLLSFAIAKDNSAIDHARLLADLDLLLGDYASCDMVDFDIGMFLNDVFALMRSSHVTLPSVITNVSRGIVTLEGTIAEYIPTLNMIQIINEHIKHTSDAETQIKEALQDAALSLKRASRGMVDAATYSGEMVKMFTRGQLKMNMEVLGSEAPMRTLSKIMNRLTIGIIIAGLFVGSSLLAPYGTGLNVLGMPLLSFLGYTSAVLLSLWVVIDIWRKH